MLTAIITRLDGRASCLSAVLCALSVLLRWTEPGVILLVVGLALFAANTAQAVLRARYATRRR